MGRALYGDEAPALRELYQNSLDACRYRRSQEALRRNDYEGRIEFRFGTTGERQYVECVDNGIGMADRHLRQLFARAGNRFTDSHEFHLDRARWEGAGIAFFPNSRFGIGVLSYFMLAEEVDVVSVRSAEPGAPNPDHPVAARILGAGNLFRLAGSFHSDRLIGSSGTSVRLYLRFESDLPRLAASIERWLGMPEFEVTLVFGDGTKRNFPARRPGGVINSGTGPLLEVPGSQGRYSGSRLFLHPVKLDTYSTAKPIIMVDGIVTRSSDDDSPYNPDDDLPYNPLHQISASFPYPGQPSAMASQTL